MLGDREDVLRSPVLVFVEATTSASMVRSGDVEFHACAVDVALDGAHRNGQSLGDGLVGHPLGRHDRDLEFPAGQRQRVQHLVEGGRRCTAGQFGGPGHGLHLALALVAGREHLGRLRGGVGRGALHAELGEFGCDGGQPLGVGGGQRTAVRQCGSACHTVQGAGHARNGIGGSSVAEPNRVVQRLQRDCQLP